MFAADRWCARYTWLVQKLDPHADEDIFLLPPLQGTWSYSLMRSAAGRFHATFFLLVFLLRGKVAKLVI